jgi:hypothetical protein
MKEQVKILVLVSMLLPAIAATADTAKEVEDWYRGYAGHWFDADVDIDAVTKYYASPFYYLGSTGPLLDTDETMKASLTSYAETWAKDGWSGARLLRVKAKILNESSAMILTEWDIHAADGSSIIGCARAPWTYLATKTKEGWKFALEVEIACGQGLVLK